MRSIRALQCGIILLSLVSTKGSIAQAQQVSSNAPTIRVTSRLVFLDVTVLDKKGHPVVNGRTKDDFVITDNKKRAEMLNQPNGLAVSKLTPKQHEILNRIIAEYANNLPPDMAAARLEEAKKTMGQMYFAWAGVEEKGGPHYYRIQTPTFIIEYDNTHDKANHVHSVWREFHGDWGLDLLKQ